MLSRNILESFKRHRDQQPKEKDIDYLHLYRECDEGVVYYCSENTKSNVILDWIKNDPDNMKKFNSDISTALRYNQFLNDEDFGYYVKEVSKKDLNKFTGEWKKLMNDSDLYEGFVDLWDMKNKSRFIFNVGEYITDGYFEGNDDIEKLFYELPIID